MLNPSLLSGKLNVRVNVIYIFTSKTNIHLQCCKKRSYQQKSLKLL